MPNVCWVLAVSTIAKRFMGLISFDPQNNFMREASLVCGEGNGPGEASDLLEVTRLGGGRIQTRQPASGWGICNC